MSIEYSFEDYKNPFLTTPEITLRAHAVAVINGERVFSPVDEAERIHINLIGNERTKPMQEYPIMPKTEYIKKG